MQSPSCMTSKALLISFRFLRWVMTARISSCGIAGLWWVRTFVNLELSSHVIVDQVWQLRAALDATKCAPLPHSSRNKLERYTPVSPHPPPPSSKTHV